ncbi:zinc-binding dehydrogenase [Nocardia terpenica]|uniref:Zinc-binding dehydrogenase n=1 Tax=Nocardia terpenica TaxID=455432 RepID=A0A6G9Z5J7_9NOCA|nr:zinc-binding dehydrogenase [Nocardia terpenica]QIS20671.1 zinc-binding dehydrogenase [Nocardia terpenica]
MRAVVVENFGEPKDVLTPAERPTPEPGPGQVRIAMTLSPIHNHDLAIVRGVYGYKPPLPTVPGTEAVGRVDAVGPDVTGVSAGQRVVVRGAQGAWAEYFLAEAAQLIPVPDTIPDETAAQLLSMPLSALILLDDLKVEKGDWIAVNAANGAVGRLLNALATERGVRVLNLVRSEAAVTALRASGAEAVVSTEAEDWRDAVTAATGGAPIVRVVDQVGGPAGGELLTLLAPGGELISFGAMSGERLVLNTGALIFKQAVVKGFWASRRMEEIGREATVRLIGELVAAAERGVLRLDIEAAYPLADAAEAAAASERPGRNAKIALRPA